VRGKIVCVTGGTGSFGNAFVRWCLKNDVKEIRIFSRDELKQEVMRDSLRDIRAKFFIGDVRDASSFSTLMEGVDWVVHAAALKQVPACEFFPFEAVKTNVIGTENVLNAAIDAGVDRAVVLSTDKACYPINAYGQTKALLEKIAISKSRFNKTICSIVRYGNILASRGSVVPLFASQVRAGNPITVTNPEMTRFLITLDEAVDLVQYAFDHGKNGDLFVKKSPASTIINFAEAVRTILNRPFHKISIIGTRHGEKTYETLVSSEEMARAEDCGEYFRLPVDGRDLNYASYVSEGENTSFTEYTSHNTQRLELNDVIDVLKNLECLGGSNEDSRSSSDPE